MHRIVLAVRAFFAVLLHRSKSEAVERALSVPEKQIAVTAEPARSPIAPTQAHLAAQRSNDALALLALLQREARFIDFIEEDLSAYTDAQIGAAARDVHRQCATVLDRVFGVGPLVEAGEGAEQTVPAGFDATRYKLTGNVTGDPPFHGRLRHHGWQATRYELPAFTGSAAAAHTLAPAEIELT